jgi:hypothetical protein
MKLAYGSKSQWEANSVAANATNAWGWNNPSPVNFAEVDASISHVNNLPNRKKTFTAVRPAQGSSKSLVTGAQLIYLAQNNPAGYTIYLKDTYTIPANYKLTLSAEMSWGRLP